jgi:drug/metabolite transporter (DMT)-like permease
LVEAQGWRTALFSLAVILAVGTRLAQALLLRHRPEDLGLHPDGQRRRRAETDSPDQPGVTLGVALHDPTFRWMTLAFCLSSAVAFGAHSTWCPILLERDFPPTLAATIAGLIAATQVLGCALMTPFRGRDPVRSRCW